MRRRAYSQFHSERCPTNFYGFALISAIFLLVILGLVSTFAVSLSGITRSTGNLSLQGVRAYFAARSGIEWGVNRITVPPNACPATTTLNLTQAGLRGFSVQVSCSSSSFTEGVDSLGAPNVYNVFIITAVAQFGSFGSDDYVSRRLQITATLGT